MLTLFESKYTLNQPVKVSAHYVVFINEIIVKMHSYFSYCKRNLNRKFFLGKIYTISLHQLSSKNVPSQFPLWFITGQLRFT